MNNLDAERSKVCGAVATTACAEILMALMWRKPACQNFNTPLRDKILKEFPLKLGSYAGVIRKIKWSNLVILSFSMSVISYSSRLKYATSLKNYVPSISLITAGLIVVTNSFLTGTKNDKYGKNAYSHEHE